MIRQNRIGQKFNRLTIIKILENASKINRVKYLCKCDCGNERSVFHNNIVYNKTKSCGCVRNEINTKIIHRTLRKPLGTSTFKNLFKCYKKSAKYRNHEFNLSEEEFKELTKNLCFYCNKEPSNKHQIKSKDQQWQTANVYIYNGIDRKDSKLGYNKENCVACCKQCNQSKMNYSEKDFLNWIKRVYEFNKL